MDCNYYKYCIVPQCESTSVKTPKKLFVHVPKKENLRKIWLQLARRDTNVSSTSRMYFCEDHFDRLLRLDFMLFQLGHLLQMPNDMENYIEYHVMGSVSQIRMKPGCLPSKFDCQPDSRKRTSSSAEQQSHRKKQRMMIIQKCLTESVETNICNSSLISMGTSSSSAAVVPMDEENSQVHRTADKSVQVLMTQKYRSKAIQANIKLVEHATSPLKCFYKSVSTSPFKVQHSNRMKPSSSGICKISKIIAEEHSDSDVSLYTPPLNYMESSPSTHSLQMKSSSDCSVFVEETQKQKLSEAIQNTINKIHNKPRFYIGVPKNSYYLIDLIVEETNIPLHHLLLCLKKIRLDSKFQELADDFSLTISYASKIFFKNVPIIASVMRPFIVKLDSQLNKKTLPMSFRHKFYNVSCIIDCLEIEIQKPTKAVHQALTWSDYKKANTMKYLISCTPGGLVNYISPGFGGRVTDTCLVESCDFVQCLEKSMVVMADRGFKHVEQYLLKSGVQLVRPPSVKTGVKLNKCEVKETKQIASLRIHVERVIRRLREFNMLKPHACININFVKILDDIITIACGLINLQDSLIK